jgi:hypothetical protein
VYVIVRKLVNSELYLTVEGIERFKYMFNLMSVGFARTKVSSIRSAYKRQLFQDLIVV